MSNFSKRALRWTAPVALVGAFGLAACGDNDDSEATRIAAPSGANAWLSEQAIERGAQLDNRAAELAEQELAYQASAGAGSEIASARANRAASARMTGQAEQFQRSQAARVAAQAEQYERSAHLEGQADTHSDVNLPNAFEAGNRAAQVAQAEQYVEQLQDRADGNRDAQKAQAEQYVEQQQDRADSNRTKLPGSHHVSTR